MLGMPLVDFAFDALGQMDGSAGAMFAADGVGMDELVDLGMLLDDKRCEAAPGGASRDTCLSRSSSLGFLAAPLAGVTVGLALGPAEIAPAEAGVTGGLSPGPAGIALPEAKLAKR